jgi:hypothetical protein
MRRRKSLMKDETKKIKTLILSLLIVTIIVIIIMIILKFHYRKEKYIDTPEIETPIIDYKEGINLISNHSTFYTIERFINKFLLYLQIENEEAAYSILDETYIKTNNITKEDIINNFQDLVPYNNGTIEIEEIYEQENENNGKYYVFGRLEKDSQRKEIYLIFSKDKKNNTFSILPINNERYYKEIKDKKDKKDIEEKTIKLNQYNKMKIEILSEEDRILKIFNEFIHNELYYPEYTYNKLDEEYRNKRFGSLEKYKEYINLHYNELVSMDINNMIPYEEFATEEEYQNYLLSLKPKALNRYKIENKDSYNRYICIDDYENYYIFKETSPFKYSVILDTYTVDLPEFLQKYKNATEQEKVALNIDKFIQAINSKDYKYAYNCLADSFKNNNFKTQEEFDVYIKEKFYEYNKAEYINFEEQGDLYTYRISIKNDETGQEIKKTFIMQLGEGTKFVLSFDK